MWHAEADATPADERTAEVVRICAVLEAADRGSQPAAAAGGYACNPSWLSRPASPLQPLFADFMLTVLHCYAETALCVRHALVAALHLTVAPQMAHEELQETRRYAHQENMPTSLATGLSQHPDEVGYQAIGSCR